MLACLTGCAARVNKPVTTTGTLAELRNVRPDVQEVKSQQGLEQAMQNYRRFLDETPQTTMTPEAMRRLADLQLEKQFGINTGARPRSSPLRGPTTIVDAQTGRPDPAAAAAGTGSRESDQDFRAAHDNRGRHPDRPQQRRHDRRPARRRGSCGAARGDRSL